MINSIKQLFTFTLFSFILPTGYIQPAQATIQEVAEKKILQDKLEIILDATAKDSMQKIESMLEAHRGQQVKQQTQLKKCVNFSLKEYKKQFFKLSLSQLQRILPKVEELKSTNKELALGMHDLIGEIVALLLGNFEKNMQGKGLLDETLQKNFSFFG